MSVTDDRQKRIERMQRIRAKVVEWAAETHPNILEAGVRCWLGHNKPSKDKVKEAFLFALIAPLDGTPSLLERYATSGQTLSRFERDMFAIWARVHFSIFTVQRVDTGVHLMLDDRISGETIVVQERTASKTLHRGDTFIAFLKPIGDAFELEGTISLLSEPIADLALAEMNAALTHAAPHGDVDRHAQTRACAQRVVNTIRAHEAETTPPARDAE